MWWRRRRQADPSPGLWPRPGAIAIVSADAQEAAFLDTAFIERMIPLEPATKGQAVLRRTGAEKWLTVNEASDLRAELVFLLERANTDEERGPLRLAVELIDFSVGGETGLLHVPAATDEEGRLHR
jgi:hypothetical protein